MKSFFWALPLVLIPCAQAAAQTILTPSDTTAVQGRRRSLTFEDGSGALGTGFQFVPYKWDISVDASLLLPRFVQISNYGYNYYGYSTAYFNNGPFLNGYNQVGNFARFMLRKTEIRNASAIPVRTGAYRLNVGISLSSNLVKQDTIRLLNTSNEYFTTTSSSNHGLLLEAGYEWQQQLGRFQLFYGYDGFIRFNRSAYNGFSHRLQQNAQGTGLEQKRERTEWMNSALNIGVAPLFGVKFFVHPRFSFSVENKFFIQYNRFREDGSYSYYATANAVRQSTTNGFATYLAPISALNATFHFGPALR